MARDRRRADDAPVNRSRGKGHFPAYDALDTKLCRQA